MKNEPLRSRRILVTRTQERAQTLIRLIEEKGGISLALPFFTLHPAVDKSSLFTAIWLLDRYDIVIFASPAAVMFGLSEILDCRDWPVETVAAAVGGGTAKLLKKNGIEQIIIPMEHFCSEGLLAHPDMQSETVRGKRVLIMRAEQGRELLARSLSQRGALVDRVTCYRRQAVDDQAFAAWVRSNRIDAITLFSTEGLHKMQKLAQSGLLSGDGKSLLAIPLFTPHQRIAQLAGRSGWRQVMTTGMEEHALVECLCKFDWQNNE